MLERSMPACFISHNGERSRNRDTSRAQASMAWSISCSVVKRPIPKRRDVWAFSSLTPRALSTYDGSNVEDVQAEPLLTAMLLSAISRLSPSTHSKLTFKFPLYLLVGCPFKMIEGIFSCNPSYSRLLSLSTCLRSRSISRCATAQASPKPTARGVGTVPLRNPRSWPPPLTGDFTRTRGRLRTYSAPTPLGPYTLWPDNDIRSMCIAFTSRGTFPSACAQSE
mmetsp:Transcript_2046/g.3776  ORF Transcript_2046/g.3776 Transcript_2046/m.3776 type:complete len:223 (-) Transcript_2046:629-1297(-)